MKYFREYLKEKQSKGSGVYIGRFQPPTIAHQSIIDSYSSKYETLYVVIVEGEKTSKESKNFLTFKERKELIERFAASNVEVTMSKSGYIADIIEAGKIETGDGVTIICGKDREASYKDMAKRVEKDYKVDVETIKRTASSVSATKVRQTLEDNDYDSYKKMIAHGLDDKKTFDELKKKYKANQ